MNGEQTQQNDASSPREKRRIMVTRDTYTTVDRSARWADSKLNKSYLIEWVMFLTYLIKKETSSIFTGMGGAGVNAASQPVTVSSFTRRPAARRSRCWSRDSRLFPLDGTDNAPGSLEAHPTLTSEYKPRHLIHGRDSPRGGVTAAPDAPETSWGSLSSQRLYPHLKSGVQPPEPG